MLCFLAVFVLMVMLDIKSLFEGSTSGITILFEIGLFVLGGIVLYKRLYDKASRNKYKTTGKISTISNRNLLKKV